MVGYVTAVMKDLGSPSNRTRLYFELVKDSMSILGSNGL